MYLPKFLQWNYKHYSINGLFKEIHFNLILISKTQR